MTGFLLRAALTALGLWVASEIFSGLHFDSPAKLLVSAHIHVVIKRVFSSLSIILGSFTYSSMICKKVFRLNSLESITACI